MVDALQPIGVCEVARLDGLGSHTKLIPCKKAIPKTAEPVSFAYVDATSWSKPFHKLNLGDARCLSSMVYNARYASSSQITLQFVPIT